ncbi:hypothetical protein BCR36DRAFT_287165 [Piromyces finnis]|uniref:Uncharacterized protein n=1 Tax=Piromyces finnis TaxID=1754191 RepID=A0A1Y1VBY7_9FUNG|nr:hypothetical protein BCR36DRAFT_287165 [Piromyces finnis]|eukprot:ORX52179.1 hypothetical protein BCR36DRAFT_287165 [Piromyces finnis]
MKRKVDGYKARLEEEVLWDYQLPRLHIAANPLYQFTYDDFERGIDGPTGMFPYGILDWTEKICNTACQQFGIEYDKVALTPETAANVEAQKIEAGTEYDTNQLQGSGALINGANTGMIVFFFFFFFNGIKYFKLYY